MYLIINTIEDDRFIIALADVKGAFIKKITKRGRLILAEKLLPTIDKLIKPKYKYQNLKGIVVASGPGGFTSIRLGIITANTFAYVLNIPIAGLTAKQFSTFEELSEKGITEIRKNKNKHIILPFYGSEPNITKPNKKPLRI